MKITNNKPCVLEPVYTTKIDGLHDVRDMMLQTLSCIFQPVIAGQQVTVTDNGTVLTTDEIITKFIECCQEYINGPVETQLKSMLTDALLYFDNNNLLIQQIFVNQSTVASGLPFASPMILYTPETDVIPVSKEFLSGICDYHKFFATMANYVQADILGFYFANENSFNEFKSWMQVEIPSLGTLPVNTNQLLADFQNLDLSGLTEAVRLRANDSSGNEDRSFPRVLIHLLMKYASLKSGVEFGVLPFNLGELYNPTNIVFVNVEKHAKAKATMIKKEWEAIKQSLALKVEVISSNQILKLTATVKNLNSVRGMTNLMAMGRDKLDRVAKVKFSESSPSKYDLANRISHIMKKMVSNNKTMNTFKNTSLTYNKANRRNPDDFNKPGKSTSISYRPDIHLYVDTSGSISESDYEEAMKICINMARKLNVNLYFNSFSHKISTCTKIHVQNRSVNEIWKAFQKIEKVGGGTNFENVWNYINASKKRKKELSIMITDFDDRIRNHAVECPKNLYYAPCSNKDWNRIVIYAKDFCESAQHTDPTIRKRILF